MTVTLTPEAAAAERQRILTDVRHLRRAAARRLRDLEQLEADCARVGIKLIREPIQSVRAQEGRHHDHTPRHR